MLHQGNCLDVLPTLESQSIQCVVTSPPYFGLRDYGVEGQMGLEKTPAEYVEKLVQVFREVRRVLRDDGTLWLNLGDSYNSPGPNNHNKSSIIGTTKLDGQPSTKSVPGLKHKDLIGIPWRVALALQADGWYLRQDIIWSKPNPMPEGVTDRCTKAHEYIFLLSKQAHYFYDADAIKEASIYGPGCGWDDAGHEIARKTFNMANPSFRAIKPTRNRRSVWTITTKPFREAHFATFPPEIPEICIKAGTSEKGQCPECGNPWVRVVEKGELVGKDRGGNYKGRESEVDAAMQNRMKGCDSRPGMSYENKTTGWQPTCSHGLDPVPQTVCDPFSGAGTVGMVAEKLDREFIGIELNPAYNEMAEKRIDAARLPLFTKERSSVVSPVLPPPLLEEPSKELVDLW